MGRRSPARRWGGVRYLITMENRGAWMHERPGGSRGARCNCLSRLRYVGRLLSSRAGYPPARAKIGKIHGRAQVLGYYPTTMDRPAADHRGTPGRSPKQGRAITGTRATDHRGTCNGSPKQGRANTGTRATDHRGTCNGSPNEVRAITGELTQAGTGAAGNARSAMRARDRIAEGASPGQRKERGATWCPRRYREPAASPTGRAVPVAAMPRSGAALWRVAS